MSCREIIAAMDMFPLEERRNRVDMIASIKLLYRFDNIRVDQLFKEDTNEITGRYNKKLSKKGFFFIYI